MFEAIKSTYEASKHLPTEYPEVRRQFGYLIAEVERLREELKDQRAAHHEEIREMQRDFQREARDIAAEAAFNATSDDPYGTY